MQNNLSSTNTINKEQRDQQLIQQLINYEKDVTLFHGGITPDERDARLQENQMKGLYKSWIEPLQKESEKYSSIADSAQQGLGYLENFDQAYKAASNIGKGKFGGLISPIFSSNMQVAIKDSANSLMQKLGTTKGLSRTTNMAMQNLRTGTVSTNLLPDAEDRIYKELKLAFQAQLMQANLFNKLYSYVGDPVIIDQVITQASTHYPTTDEAGELHPENLYLMSKYASPMAAIVISQGKDYFPEDIRGLDMNGLKQAAYQRGIPLGIAVHRAKLNMRMRDQKPIMKGGQNASNIPSR
jgi:hypothetical protein